MTEERLLVRTGERVCLRIRRGWRAGVSPQFLNIFIYHLFQWVIVKSDIIKIKDLTRICRYPYKADLSYKQIEKAKSPKDGGAKPRV